MSQHSLKNEPYSIPVTARESAVSTDKSTIAVIGLGYVGLPLALLADRKGYHVTGIDTSNEKVAHIRQRKVPFADAELTEGLRVSSLDVTMDFAKVKKADIVIICVPTPVDEARMPDLRPIENAARAVSVHLRKGHLVILESTVNPGVSENVILPILEKNSGLKAGSDFSIAHCPERINPGDMRWNVANIPRVVGALDEKGLQKSLEFYSSLIDASVKPMRSLKEAEAVKIVENAFRDINIAFVNELAMSFTRLGIDVLNVIEGAATKPFAFLPHYPGCGVGGHCIPVDPYYLIEHAKKNGFDHELLSRARKINSTMPAFTVERLDAALKEKGETLRGTSVAVLGLAYKPEIDDCRESPAFGIIEELEKHGANVISFDPFVPEQSTHKSLEEALFSAHAVIIATGHHIFRNLTPEVFINHGVKVVVDGRNCLPKEQFENSSIVYRGIGR